GGIRYPELRDGLPHAVAGAGRPGPVPRERGHEEAVRARLRRGVATAVRPPVPAGAPADRGGSPRRGGPLSSRRPHPPIGSAAPPTAHGISTATSRRATRKTPSTPTRPSPR